MFLAPQNSQEDQSNILMFWDSIPKYSISRQQQAKMRSESGQLPILRQHFRYDGQEYEMELTPAYLLSPENETGIAHYPSYTEELIEDVLRKFLLDDTLGRYEKEGSSPRAGVSFSVSMIRSELARMGKTRSLNEIKQALEVMQGARIRIRKGQTAWHGDSILNGLTMVTRENWRDALCSAWFSVTVSKAIASLAFRQIDYAWLMRHRTQLSRWLFRRLSHTYLNASLQHEYEISQTDIEQESGLLHHARASDRRVAIRKALDDLVRTDCLLFYDTIRVLHGRQVKYIYKLHANPRFVSYMKRVNCRQQMVAEQNAQKN